MAIDLVPIWTGILALSVFMYVLLDGFDLGVGMMFPFAANDDTRTLVMNTVAPIWDGNETWLVMGGIGLFAARRLMHAMGGRVFLEPNGFGGSRFVIALPADDSSRS